MPFFKKTVKVLAFWAAAAACMGAQQVPPVSLTLFGLYGSPVQPTLLARTISDAFGGEVLGEWNPSSLASVGLSYERTYFQNAPGFTLSVLSLEGRVFPFENGKDKFSPYLYGGAGLDLDSPDSTILLKAGVGSRVSLIGPFFADIAVGSHWAMPPDNLQYVSARAGVGLWFNVGGHSAASPSPSASSAPAPRATPVPETQPATAVETAPQASPTPMVLSLGEEPTATPTEVVLGMEEAEPTPTEAPAVEAAPASSAMLEYYHRGMNDFLTWKYHSAIRWLKKAAVIRDPGVPFYYYAETYATLGVIYEFHVKTRNHMVLADRYYRKALKIDPATKSARKYFERQKSRHKGTSHHYRRHRPAKKPEKKEEGSSTSITYTGY